MPKDDTESQNGHANSKPPAGAKVKADGKAPASSNTDSFFKLPKPLKQVFDKFPLKTYAPNDLPSRASRNKDQHVLYIFSTEEDASKGYPSFNPACLKWQTYLHFSGTPHTLLPSTNHASPSGALPFLLPAHATTAIPSSRLQKWTSSQSNASPSPEPPLRAEAYTTLLDHRIRAAWLHSLYLSTSNTSVAQRLYISPATTSPIVQLTLSHQLQSAAHGELLKLSPSATSNAIKPSEIYTEAGHAFDALSTLLGENEWFFGESNPGIFDASVFAYTYLILDRENMMQWQDRRLNGQLRRFGNLVAHCDRIFEKFYTS